MTEYKPLTPSFRQNINIGFNNQISELQTCEQNGLVIMQIAALKTYQNLINSLPDGYLIPVRKR